MKHNYRTNKKTITAFLILLLSIIAVQAQTIEFYFENAQNTNDGADDFYEVDIMISTTNGLADFKLGSGLLYFKFNEAAFGTWIKNTGGIVEYTQPEAEGYIAGQGIDLIAAIGIYGTFITNDNQSDVTAWSFQQLYSSSTFANNNVTAIPTKLCHLKFKYLDVAQLPMLEFVTDTDIDQASDQFFTACGDDSGGPTTTANCAGFPGTQILDASYINTGSVLAVEDIKLNTLNIQVYPNPATDIINISSSIELQKIELFTILGAKVLESTETTQIDISNLESAVYLVKLYSDTGSKTMKLVKK